MCNLFFFEKLLYMCNLATFFYAHCGIRGHFVYKLGAYLS